MPLMVSPFKLSMINFLTLLTYIQVKNMPKKKITFDNDEKKLFQMCMKHYTKQLKTNEKRTINDPRMDEGKRIELLDKWVMMQYMFEVLKLKLESLIFE